ncbi:MAG: transposase [Oscillibacter sp.]|nr:transposase [Oscillibacter sp.]
MKKRIPSEWKTVSISRPYSAEYSHCCLRAAADHVRVRKAQHPPAHRQSGPAPGRPPKNPALSRQAKKLEYQDNCDRGAVEGIFGTGKTAYGPGRIMARLKETAFRAIGAVLLPLHLSGPLRPAPALLCLPLAAAFSGLAE